MYFSSAGDNFLKAQVQNHYEKIRCDLYIKDVTKRHVHSLANINKSIKEAKDALKDIQSSSGHCKEVQENETAPKSNVWKEAEWSTAKNQPNGGHVGKSDTQARQKTGGFQEIGSKNLESSESKMTVSGASRSLFLEKNGRNVVEEMEYSMQKNGAGGDVNGDRSDIIPAGRFLRDEILMLADSRSVSDRGVKGANRQGSDPSARNANIKGSQLKSVSSVHGGDFQNTTSTKPTAKNLGSLPSRTDIPARPNTAPKKAMSKGELKENSTSRYLSDTDVKKVKIQVSLSKAERKKILQGLISGCAVPCDRSGLERERQRRLQEKIHRFFEMLFEQDEKDDGSHISGDD